MTSASPVQAPVSKLRNVTSKLVAERAAKKLQENNNATVVQPSGSDSKVPTAGASQAAAPRESHEHPSTSVPSSSSSSSVQAADLTSSRSEAPSVGVRYNGPPPSGLRRPGGLTQSSPPQQRNESATAPNLSPPGPNAALANPTQQQRAPPQTRTPYISSASTNTSRPGQQQQSPPPSRDSRPGQTRNTDRPSSRDTPHLSTGLAVTWLGTSSGTPTVKRNVSCTLVSTPAAIYQVSGHICFCPINVVTEPTYMWCIYTPIFSLGNPGPSPLPCPTVDPMYLLGR